MNKPHDQRIHWQNTIPKETIQQEKKDKRNAIKGIFCSLYGIYFHLFPGKYKYLKCNNKNLAKEGIVC